MAIRFIKQLLLADKLFRWGIMPGRYFYIADYFEVLSRQFPEEYLALWPRLILLLKDGEMQVIGDQECIDKQGKLAFQDYLASAIAREQLFQGCELGCRQLVAFWSQEKFSKLQLLSKPELIALGAQFVNVIAAFWLPTMVIELANYGALALLKEKHGRDLYARQDLIDELVFAEPTFYQKEERELYNAHDLASHQRKYFWLENNYACTKSIDMATFSRRKELLNDQHVAADLHEKQKVKGDMVLAIMRQSLWYQQERKQYILQLQHYKDLFLRAAAKHLCLVQDKLYAFSLSELLCLLQDKYIPSREGAIGVDCQAATHRFLSSSSTSYAWTMITNHSANPDISMIVNVIVPGSQTSVVGTLVFDAKDIVSSEAIFVTHTITVDQLYLIAQVQAIVVENYTSISHAVFMAYACKYARSKVRPAFIVIPNIYQHFQPGQQVTIDTIQQTIHCVPVYLSGQIASRSTKSIIQGTIFTPSTIPIPDNGILFVEHLTIDLILRFRTSLCFLSSTGGITSHASILSRELGIPYILGIKNIQHLQAGDSIEVNFIDGTIRKVGMKDITNESKKNHK